MNADESQWEPEDRNSQAAVDARRLAAQKFRAENGRLPDDWEFGCAIETLAQKMTENRRGRNALRFPDGPEAMWEQGMEYIRYCIGKQWFPCKSGLLGYLNFSSSTGFDGFLRRRPEFREVAGQLIWLLSLPLEQAMIQPGFNTKGLMFRLENLPGVLESDDDAKQIIEKPWQARPSVAIALDPTTLKVQIEDRPASEIYREMLKAGRRIEEPADETTAPRSGNEAPEVGA